MEKTRILLFALISVFFLSFIAILFNHKLQITSYSVALFFLSALGLVLLNQSYALTSSPVPTKMDFQPRNKLTLSISLLVNICLALFIVWIMGRAGVLSLSFMMAIILLAAVGLTWLFFGGLLNKISIAYIIILAIALRLIWSFSIAPQPCDDFYNYWMTAQKMFYSIAPFQTKSPLTIIFYGIISYISDKQLWAAYIANSLVAGLQVWLIYKISDFITQNELSGKMAAILYAIFPTAVAFSSVISAEVVMVTMVLAAAYFLCRKFYLDSLQDAPNYKLKNIFLLFIMSLCVAVAYLSRNTAILFLYTIVVGILFFSSKKLKQRILEVIVMLALFFVFISPLIISNYHHYGKPSMVSVHISGLVLLHGVSRETAGRYDPVARDKVLAELGYTNKQMNNPKVIMALSKRAGEVAIDNIMSDKLGFIKFAMTNKFDHMWVLENYSKSVMYESKAFKDKSSSQLAMRKIDNISTQYYLGLWMLTLFSILVACIKRNIFISMLACYILFTFALHFFYEAASRYHFPIMPFACIIASYLVAESCVLKNFILKKSEITNRFFIQNRISKV